MEEKEDEDKNENFEKDGEDKEEAIGGDEKENDEVGEWQGGWGQ